jgi:starch phosphorylase
MGSLYEKYLGPDIVQRYDDVNIREPIMNIPDDDIWQIHRTLKHKLLRAMHDRAQNSWAEGKATPQQILHMGALLIPEVLTIGFVRRFAEYKRPTLIFHDIERLKRIINDRWRPVQIIFAGKSHPADMASKNLLHQVYTLAMDRAFQGRIAFVEDYDMHMARYLVQGVDVWLNTPRRFNEACGTSGMKAAANGVLHLSVNDGWWREGYNGDNGWVIGDDSMYLNPEDEDKADAESLYHLLEDEIVPLFYNRDCGGTPCQWTRMVKQSIGSVVPFFSSRRMLKEYVERMYVVAASRS